MFDGRCETGRAGVVSSSSQSSSGTTPAPGLAVVEGPEDGLVGSSGVADAGMSLAV